MSLTHPFRAWLAAALSLAVQTAGVQGSIIQVASYDLGEPGSIGGAQPYNPLVDSVGGDNNIANWNTAALKTSVITTGLAAPGSTHALQISANENTGGTWYNSSFNGGAGLTDNWAFDLWVRPDLAVGTYLGATDGDGGTQQGVRIWASNTTQSGTSLGGNTMAAGTTRLLASNGSGFLGNAGSTYVTGTWARFTLVRHSGTLHYYLNEALQDSAATPGKVNDIRLGAGYWATVSSNGAFDQLKVYSFDGSDSLASVEQAMFQTVPEAASASLFLIGALLLRRFRFRS